MTNRDRELLELSLGVKLATSISKIAVNVRQPNPDYDLVVVHARLDSGQQPFTLLVNALLEKYGKEHMYQANEGDFKAVDSLDPTWWTPPLRTLPPDSVFYNDEDGQIAITHDTDYVYILIEGKPVR